MPKKKISDQQKLEIVEKIIDGKTFKEIGEEYSVHPNAIHHIYKYFSGNKHSINEIEYLKKATKLMKELKDKSINVEKTLSIVENISENNKYKLLNEIDSLILDFQKIRSRVE